MVAAASSTVVSSLNLETDEDFDTLSMMIFLQAMTTDIQKCMNISAQWDFTHTTCHPIFSHHGSNTDVLSPIRRMPQEKLSSVVGVFFIFHPHHSGSLYKNRHFRVTLNKFLCCLSVKWDTFEDNRLQNYVTVGGSAAI